MTTDRRKDPQRQQVYCAGDPLMDWGITFDSHAEVQRFVHHLTSTEWWRKTYPKVHDVEVYESEFADGASWATASGPYRIYIHPKARCEVVIYHELAHLVTRKGTAHGPRFAYEFAWIVTHFNRMMGLELQKYFTIAGVKGMDAIGNPQPPRQKKAKTI